MFLGLRYFIDVDDKIKNSWKKNGSWKLYCSNNEFYKKVGDSLKKNYKNCTAWLISSDIENLKMIGLKPTSKIEVMNGNLKCSFREFKIYEGSKKQKYQKS